MSKFLDKIQARLHDRLTGSSTDKGGVFRFIVITQIVLIALKVFNVTSITWVEVLIPVIIVSVGLFVFIAAMFLYFIRHFEEMKEIKRQLDEEKKQDYGE